MAPFGKNFLKARQKHRTKDAESVEGKEIQVTVCNEDKVICGVTKHTTCIDMIQALLDDHESIPESKRLLHGEARDFCLVERWKGFERALPPLTRILRLWSAWGDQRPFIQFTLVKTSDFVPPPAKKAGKAKGAKPKRWEHQPQPAERQKRMVKKAFRKLEKLHKESKSSLPGAEEVDRMVQLILDQDHTIREQIRHMRGLDLGIEQFELEMQNEAAWEVSPGMGAYADEYPQEEYPQEEYPQEEYPRTADRVQQIELEVQRHQELILELSLDIDAELRRAADFPRSQRGDGEREGASASRFPSETEELERLREEVERSLLAGVSLHNQAAEMSKQLICYEAALVSKDQECWQLAAQLSSLHIGEAAGGEEEEEEESSPVPPMSEAQCGGGGGVSSQAVKLKGSVSPLDVTDTDSDTGISSTHSQDSLSPCLDFPPPLDTDV